MLEVSELDLPARVQVAFCGPSGSGKTSFLHVLAALARPTRGAVVWGSTNVAALRPGAADQWRRATVGFVFQQFHLLSGLSVLENVLLPIRFGAFTVAAKQRDEALALVGRVGLDPHQRVETLSRGEMQRVAVARALLKRPALVFADEPTASLDVESAQQVTDLLCQLCRDAATTLIVATHDAELARRMDERYDIAQRSLHGRESGRGGARR